MRELPAGSCHRGGRSRWRFLLSLLATSVVLQACGMSGSPRDVIEARSFDLVPTFEPAVRDGGAGSPDAVSASSVTDPPGDTTAPLVGHAPAWADLVGGTVVREPTGEVTITVELAAPPRPPRSGTAMHLAAFHDRTGDGSVDLEVWVIWSQDGWYPFWRDHTRGDAAFGEGSQITVHADAAAIELHLPAEHFAGTAGWRWSLALEWAHERWLGTPGAARDHAPDEGAVTHPG